MTNVAFVALAAGLIIGLGAVGAGSERNRFDAHSGGVGRMDGQGNQRGQRYGDPTLHLQLHCISMFAA